MIEPLSFYASDSETSLKFYVIDCGQGSMNLIVFPDSTVMLFDCNVTNDNKEKILDFLNHVIPKSYDGNKYIDIFVNSHRDDDHLHGLKEINERFPISAIWDSGQSGATTDNPDYKYYMYLRRKLNEEYEDGLKELASNNKSIASFGNANIYCLSAKNDYQDKPTVEDLEESERIQHRNCIVLLIEYAGRKLLLSGDSDCGSWKENIASRFGNKNSSPNYSNITVLIASHHGSRTFFTNEDEIDKTSKNTYLEHIKLMKPVITLISCGDKEIHGHPNEDAVKIYKNNSSNKQVYTTHDFGTFDGIIKSNGDFTVVPDMFKNSPVQHVPRFEIKCNSNGTPIRNNESRQIGINLNFSLFPFSGILNNHDKIKIIWIVSNGGIERHDDHQEIYFKENDEPSDKFHFSRDLEYKGTHLLWCYVHNYTKRLKQTCVFKITGI